jgi:TonB-dependent SusC/RagA subfamily outer membrane receptor
MFRSLNLITRIALLFYLAPLTLSANTTSENLPLVGEKKIENHLSLDFQTNQDYTDTTENFVVIKDSMALNDLFFAHSHYRFFWRISEDRAKAFLKNGAFQLSSTILRELFLKKEIQKADSLPIFDPAAFPENLSSGLYIEIGLLETNLYARLVSHSTHKVYLVSNGQAQFVFLEKNKDTLSESTALWLGNKRLKYQKDLQLYKLPRFKNTRILYGKNEGLSDAISFAFFVSPPSQKVQGKNGFKLMNNTASMGTFLVAKQTREGHPFMNMPTTLVNSPWFNAQTSVDNQFYPHFKKRKVRVNNIFKGWFWRNKYQKVKRIFVRNNYNYRKTEDVYPYQKKFISWAQTSKPIYKPLDSLHAKFVVYRKNGKPYNKEVRLRITDEYLYSDSVITILKPYAPGVYLVSMALPEAGSKKLRLDNEYQLHIEKKGSKLYNPDDYYGNLSDKDYIKKRKQMAAVKFYFEEYSLKGITLKVSQSKDKWYPSDSVSFQASVHDENNLPVTTGKFNILTQVDKVMDWDSTIAVHPVVLDTTIYPNPKGEFKFDVSRSQIPKVTFSGSTKVVYTSTDGEIYEERLTFTSYRKDLSTADSLANERKTDKQWEPFVQGNRSKDSIKLSITSPSAQPFWYVLFRKNKVIKKGYSHSLTFNGQDKSSANYYLRLSFLSNGTMQYRQLDFALQNRLIVQAEHSTITEPGAPLQINFTVTDKLSGKPVPNAHITAVSVKKSFQTTFDQAVPVSKYQLIRKKWTTNRQHNAETIIDKYVQDQVMHESVAKHLGVEQHLYYQLLHTKVPMHILLPNQDGQTTVCPIVVQNGAAVPSEIVYLNNDPIFFRGLSFVPYDFEISPGFSDISIRTANATVTRKFVEIQKGFKNIVVLPAEATKDFWHEVKSRNNSFDSFEKGLVENRTAVFIAPPNRESSFINLKTIRPNILMFSPQKFSWLTTVPDITPYQQEKIQRENKRNSALNRSPFYNNQYGNLYYYPNRTFLHPFKNLTYHELLNNIHRAFPVFIPSSTHNLISYQQKDEEDILFNMTPGYIHQLEQNFIRETSLPNYFFSFLNSPLTSPRLHPPLLHLTWTPSRLKALQLSQYTTDLQNNSQILYAYSNTSGFAKVKWAESDSIVFTIITQPNNPSFFKYIGANKAPETEILLGTFTLRHFGIDGKLLKTNFEALEPKQTVYIDKNLRHQRYQQPDSLDLVYYQFVLEKMFNESAYGEVYLKNDTLLNLEVDESIFTQSYSGKVVDARTGSPLSGVSIQLLGSKYGTVTNEEGGFSLKGPMFCVVRVASVGYDPLEVELFKGTEPWLIKLSLSESRLEDVVVVGYGTSRKNFLTGATAKIVSQELQGRVAGLVVGVDKAKKNENIRIRGASSLKGENAPLIVLNGEIFIGDLSALPLDLLETVEVLKDKELTSIYGSRAANGVVLINTKSGSDGKIQLVQPSFQEFLEKIQQDLNVLSAMAPDEEELSVQYRNNFKDAGFWVPNLLTDKNGKATTTVVLPDDITGWKNRFVAFSPKGLAGEIKTETKSYKRLSAVLSTPTFLIENDHSTLIGKLNSLDSIPIQLDLQYMVDDSSVLRKALSLKGNSSVNLPLGLNRKRANDSVEVKFGLQSNSGYSDGELRKIPIYEKGSEGVFGLFASSSKNATYTPVHFLWNGIPYPKTNLAGTESSEPVQVDSLPRKIREMLQSHPQEQFVLYLAGRQDDMFLEDIKKLQNYAYLCNEQAASKLKAELIYKDFCKRTGKVDRREKQIYQLLNHLKSTQRSDRTWGWWKNSDTEWWITLHVYEALSMANSYGYKLDGLDASYMSKALVAKFTESTAAEKIKILTLLAKEKVNMSYDKEMEAANAFINPSKSEYNPLLPFFILELNSALNKPFNIDSVWAASETSSFGHHFWRASPIKEKDSVPFANHFQQPYHIWKNDLQATLSVYRTFTNYQNLLLAQINRAKQDSSMQTPSAVVDSWQKAFDTTSLRKERILDYFLHLRETGQVHNTFERISVLEALWPDLSRAISDAKNESNPKPIQLELINHSGAVIKQKSIRNLPYTDSSFLTMDTFLHDLKSIKVLANQRYYLSISKKLKEEDPSPVYGAFTVNTKLVPQSELDTEKPISFLAKKDTMVRKADVVPEITLLNTGQVYELQVTIQVKEKMEYVMVEVPIPAGTSYHDKPKGNSYYEVYREYRKEKVAIFYRQLPQGSYDITIPLAARFEGTYSLNPARVEQMYFPTLMGREGLKKVIIQTE